MTSREKIYFVQVGTSKPVPLDPLCSTFSCTYQACPEKVRPVLKVIVSCCTTSLSDYRPCSFKGPAQTADSHLLKFTDVFNTGKAGAKIAEDALSFSVKTNDLVMTDEGRQFALDLDLTLKVLTV